LHCEGICEGPSILTGVNRPDSAKLLDSTAKYAEFVTYKTVENIKPERGEGKAAAEGWRRAASDYRPERRLVRRSGLFSRYRMTAHRSLMPLDM